MTASAEDSIKIKQPKFVSFQIADGLVLPTSRITGETRMPNVASLSLKYSLSAKGDKWEDLYYGAPYRGIGFYKPFYSMSREMGRPFSVFLFQGAQLKKFRDGLSLNYEINLGISFNWNHYDVTDRPYFEAIGSSVNAHPGGNLYLKKSLSKRLDLHLGLDFLHFSNGSQRTPNYGINSMSAIVELAYKINSDKSTEIATVTPPAKFEKRTAHDFSFFVTNRTVNIDTVETNLRNQYPEYRFRVIGLNYACMWQQTRRFMWGPSVEVLYDEGNRVNIFGDISEDTGLYREIVQLGKVSERFTVGLSVKGEFAMPGYAVFANLGYDILHSNKRDKRLYQIYGLKVYFTENLSSSFGVRSNNLTHSKYLYLSIGYTFRTPMLFAK
ncbi:MAG: acyloxyacyl hydrolase [Tannerella sp.]|nr:acyloxyacyl hydrolase [Tannerella sp.]